MTDQTCAKAYIEISCGWAKANPALFTDTVLNFQQNYPGSAWLHSIDFGRVGFMTFTANARPSSALTFTGAIAPVSISFVAPESRQADRSTFTQRVKAGGPGMYYSSI